MQHFWQMKWADLPPEKQRLAMGAAAFLLLGTSFIGYEAVAPPEAIDGGIVQTFGTPMDEESPPGAEQGARQIRGMSLAMGTAELRDPFSPEHPRKEDAAVEKAQAKAAPAQPDPPPAPAAGRMPSIAAAKPPAPIAMREMPGRKERKPPKAAGNEAAKLAPQPALKGIVRGKQHSTAVISYGGQELVLEAGEEKAGLRCIAIAEDGVVVRDAGGERKLGMP